KLVRAFLFLLVISAGLGAGGVIQAQAAPAASVGMVQSATGEDADAQSRTLAEAYNVLLDHYVHPLDTAALLHAAWDNLAKEADSKAAPPGPSPDFTGDRAADLQTMREALGAYLAKPNSQPDGFTAAHALIRGMVRYVDEGHTYFLDQQQYRDYQSWSRGDNTYVGIGISVTSKDSEPRIVEVYEGTPAQQAGLQAGDRLVSIDGQSVAGMALDEMTTLVRGPAGTDVRLVIQRGDDPTERPFDVQRAEIHLQFVKDKVVEDDIGYVLLRGFPEPSVVDSIEQDVTAFESEGVHGLVLDLRGNSGGRIDVGTRLLSHFLPNGSSVYQEVDRGGQNSLHSTHGSGQYALPLVVLVDGGTASMGEIFAAAVQEHGAATILGSNTAGSVAAAQVFGLPDGSGLQVTVFEILSSDGKPLNNVGVAPDEVIADDASGASDPVLARAIEILHNQIAANAGA
ncbi:MAG: S41 family peptidase, partial [Chloroflexi bacterium]|nr:S41 family peptidase [Chloroflexota bacterium]